MKHLHLHPRIPSIKPEKILWLAVLAILLFSTLAPAKAQPATTTTVYLPLMFGPLPPPAGGPAGGHILDIAIDPTNPNVVYVGTFGGGVFRSEDRGVTWRHANLGINDGLINTLGMDPVTPSVLFAGPYTAKQVFKTTISGWDWSRSAAGVQPLGIAFAITVNPSDHNQVYLATRGNNSQPYGGILYKSTDGGVTWTPKLANIGYDINDKPIQDYVYSIAVSARSPNVIFAAFHLNGVWRSTDFGETWAPVNLGIIDKSARTLAIDPQTVYPNQTVYLGVWYSGGVYKSTDSGNTWNSSSIGLGGAPSVLKIVIDPAQLSTLYLADPSQGVFKSTYAGGNWSHIGISYPADCVAVDPSNHNRIYVGTVSNGLWISDDGGGTLRQAPVNFGSVTSAPVDPGIP